VARPPGARALRRFADDRTLLEAVSRGEFALHGFLGLFR
jgi:hypothetical protein